MTLDILSIQKQAIAIQEARHNRHKNIGSAYPQVGVDDTLERLAQRLQTLSEQTGIAQTVLENIGSMYVQASIARREDKCFNPRSDVKSSIIDEIERLGFTIPEVVWASGV